MDLWSARDAVVMKALALGLPHYLPLSPRCTHLKGHGGLKYAVRQGLAYLPHHHFVLKTDVRAYYASIDHQLLMDRLAVHIADRQILLSSGSISGVVRSGVAYSGATRKASRQVARSVRFWRRFS